MNTLQNQTSRIEIFQPCALNELGARSNNEDSIYPAQGMATNNNTFFLVCDGMGGHEHGEVASHAVTSVFAQQLSNNQIDTLTTAQLQQVLHQAYDRLDTLDKEHESQKKMGTTFTFLALRHNEVVMAHIGDSRIYHLGLRKGSWQILYQSPDHSLVGALLAQGLITAEEAQQHPQRNVITRAMQPQPAERFMPEIHTTHDVQPNDVFFLCTDGVLEQLSNDKLLAIVAQNKSPEESIQAVKACCQQDTKDNFSAYYIKVKMGVQNLTADSDSKNTPQPLTAAPLPQSSPEKLVQEDAEVVVASIPHAAASSSTAQQRHTTLRLAIILAFVAIVLGLWMWWKQNKPNATPQTYSIPIPTAPSTPQPQPEAQPILQPEAPTAPQQPTAPVPSSSQPVVNQPTEPSPLPTHAAPHVAPQKVQNAHVAAPKGSRKAATSAAQPAEASHSNSNNSKTELQNQQQKEQKKTKALNTLGIEKNTNQSKVQNQQPAKEQTPQEEQKKPTAPTKKEKQRKQDPTVTEQKEAERKNQSV